MVAPTLCPNPYLRSCYFVLERHCPESGQIVQNPESPVQNLEKSVQNPDKSVQNLESPVQNPDTYIERKDKEIYKEFMGREI